MTAPTIEPPAPEDFDFSTIQVEEEPEEIQAPKATKESHKRGEDSSSTASPKSKSPLPRYTEGKYVKPVMAFYGYVSMGVSMTGDQECATAIMESGEACAIAWDKLAKENHAVRRVLAAMTEGGMWAGVALAHLPLLLTVAAHHGKVPPGVAELAKMMTGPSQEEESASGNA